MNKISVIIFLTMICKTMYAQSPIGQTVLFDHKALYKVSFQLDSNSHHTVEEVAELLINDTVSLFRSVNYGKKDSMLYATWKKNGSTFLPMESLALTPTQLRFNVVKKADSVFLFEDIENPLENRVYWYGQNAKNEKWELLDETKVLAGYNCQKASISLGGRVWHAWFTEDIPINDGPYKFSGLPGLILSIYDQNNTWKMELLSIFPNSNTVVDFYKIPNLNLSSVTKERFFELKRYFRDNVFNILMTSGMLKGVSKEALDNVKKTNEKYALENNNWIELYP